MKYLLAVILLLVPITMHLHRIDPPHEFWMYQMFDPTNDTITWWKSRFLIGLAFPLGIAFWALTPQVLAWFSFGYLQLLLLSTIFSDAPYLAVFGNPNYNEGALCWMSYIFVMIGATQVSKEFLTKVLTISIYSIAFFALLQQFFGNFLMLPFLHPLITSEDLGMLAPKAIGSTFGNPNHLGLYSAMLLPFALANLKTWESYIPVVLAIYMLVATSSRGAYIAGMISSGYVVYHFETRLHLKHWSVILFAGLIAFFLSHPVLHLHVFDRLFIWRHSLRPLSHTIWLGEGMSAFPLYFPQAINPGPFWNTLVDRPHNLLIQVTHGTGLVSLLVLLSIFYTSFKRAPLSHRSAILGFLIAALFTDSFVGVTPLFFAIVGNCWSKHEDR